MITHALPAGIGDCDDPAHRGFNAFLYLIGALQPRLFLHDHVAPTQGAIEHRAGVTRVVNVFDHQVLDVDCPAAPTAGR